MRSLSFVANTFGIILAALCASNVAAATCASMAGKTFGSASVVAASDVKPPLGVVGLDASKPTVVAHAFCRVQGVIRPTSDSNIKFEVWLPPLDAWNGKYQGVGNGAFGGSLVYDAMGWALKAGYAVAATDTGHEGGPLDAAWAVGHPEKVTDFGWRAIHETAVASKSIVGEYYGKGPAYSYFNGCSNGGRQALMEAQRFPDDYNGIVVGAPANFWTKETTGAIWVAKALTEEPRGWLSPENLSTVTKATLAACRAKDGYLDDPRQCHFDPAALLCKPGQSQDCLSAPQIKALKKIYSGLQDASGKTIYPGYSPGGEAGQPGWSLWLTGFEPKRVAGSLYYGMGYGFFGNIVYGKPDIDLGSMNIDEALALANEKAAKTFNAQEADLSAFKARGGKIIHYHGWNDQAIPPVSSIQYYEAVASQMGGVDSIKSFYRLFMAPGMEHCGRGAGPDAIGGLYGMPSPSQDPEHDVISALARWVENGIVPDRITATKYNDNDPSKGVKTERSWYPYPKVR